VLESFLDIIGLEKNEETRFIAFARIVDLREAPLKIFIEKNNIEEKKALEMLDKSYDFVQKYHFKIHTDIINEVRKNNLLTPFYLEIIA
jgi:hypothetical protein